MVCTSFSLSLCVCQMTYILQNMDVVLFLFDIFGSCVIFKQYQWFRPHEMLWGQLVSFLTSLHTSLHIVVVYPLVLKCIHKGFSFSFVDENRCTHRSRTWKYTLIDSLWVVVFEYHSTQNPHWYYLFNKKNDLPLEGVEWWCEHILFTIYVICQNRDFIFACVDLRSKLPLFWETHTYRTE